MSPWPDWRLLALIGCGLVAVAAATGILAIIGGAILSRRAGDQPAPGADQDPVPGPSPATPPAGRQQETQPLPPAPGLTYEDRLHLVLWADELRDRL